MHSKLGLGPMSTEIIEAIFRYSHFHRKQLMMIPSKNQIDHEGGYVNSWTTKQFMDFVRELKAKYEFSDVKVCRDHCGPGFNGNFDLEDTYSSIRSDVESGFDLIHIDFAHFKGTMDERLEASKKAVELCLSLNPNIALEIGTDENLGVNVTTNELGDIEKEVDFFLQFCKPEFYVVQTGSLVKEMNQVGTYNSSFIERVAEALHAKGVKLKEHNADYLTSEEIEKRKGIVDAVNIAPQLGVIQTSLVLTKCLQYGVDFSKYLDVVYNGGKWKKWLYTNDLSNKMLCCLVSGHYHFCTPEFKEIMEKLKESEDISEKIIESIMEVIEHYESRQ